MIGIIILMFSHISSQRYQNARFPNSAFDLPPSPLVGYRVLSGLLQAAACVFHLVAEVRRFMGLDTESQYQAPY